MTIHNNENATRMVGFDLNAGKIKNASKSNFAQRQLYFLTNIVLCYKREHQQGQTKKKNNIFSIFGEIRK